MADPPRRRASTGEDGILDVVVALVEEGGPDAVQLREVARRAQVSLSTVYKLFGSRDALLIAAVRRWQAVNGAARPLSGVPDETLRAGLVRIFRHVFEPWVRNPRMLEAFHRARSAPGGAVVDQQSWDAVEPVARALLERADPALAGDLEVVLTHVGDAVVARFAAGDLDVAAILPTLERAVFRLTADNAAETGDRPPA